MTLLAPLESGMGPNGSSRAMRPGAHVNDLHVSRTTQRLASCTYLRYDPATGTMQAARAGHVPLMCANGHGRATLVEVEGGPVLGVLPGFAYPTESFHLAPIPVT
jgi:serine phosphatase RsbU (regulator of sigma subunit)